MTVEKDCTCFKCVLACHSQPGWFAPGEAEKAAEFLGIDFEEFKKTHIVKDHCDNHDAPDAPYVWAPRKVEVDVGNEVRCGMHQRIQGKCVFLNKDDRCSIHSVKPYECRKVMACDFNYQQRDDIEQMYVDAKAPLGMRDE